MTPGPISPSAQASRTKDREDPLDHLPPLDLPGEVTRSTTPPRPPAAERETNPASDSKTSARAESSPSESELEVGAIAIPAPDASSLTTTGPPLSRFVSVDLKLAGGSTPTTAGLKWLAEKGYRTVLDLRETSDVSPSFVNEVTNQNLRYIALPLTLKNFDPAHIARFNYEVAAADSRPLFFFDQDGSTSGALWYIRRVVVDRVDQEIARREAQELGLANSAYWQAAAAYLARLSNPAAKTALDAAASCPDSQPAKGARATPNPARETARTVGRATSVDPKKSTPPKSAPAQASVTAATKPAPPKNTAIKTTASPPSQPEPKASVSNQSPVAPEPAGLGEPNDWRPFAAMVVTGLSLPLAFCCRTVVPAMVEKALASLPAPVLRQKSLPSKSDA